jgi:hypothetical protein
MKVIEKKIDEEMFLLNRLNRNNPKPKMGKREKRAIQKNYNVVSLIYVY